MAVFDDNCAKDTYTCPNTKFTWILAMGATASSANQQPLYWKRCGHQDLICAKPAVMAFVVFVAADLYPVNLPTIGEIHTACGKRIYSRAISCLVLPTLSAIWSWTT